MAASQTAWLPVAPRRQMTTGGPGIAGLHYEGAGPAGRYYRGRAVKNLLCEELRRAFRSGGVLCADPILRPYGFLHLVPGVITNR